MDENCLTYGIEISDSNWEKTPASIKQLVEKMGQHIKQSEKRLADLENKLCFHLRLPRGRLH